MRPRCWRRGIAGRGPCSNQVGFGLESFESCNGGELDLFLLWFLPERAQMAIQAGGWLWPETETGGHRARSPAALFHVSSLPRSSRAPPGSDRAERGSCCFQLQDESVNRVSDGTGPALEGQALWALEEQDVF